MEKAKKRTQSQCREWERQRRNKFNEAINKLGEVVQNVNKANENCDNTENVQYPKMEIIQKAIACLTNCIQEKTRLKAEILALQIELQAIIKNKQDKKDVSTQVFIKVSKKSKKENYLKVLMVEDINKGTTTKLKQTENKNEKSLEKPSETLPVTITDINQNKRKTSTLTSLLPKLLPRTNNVNRKGPENTIVVLPAAPYIFPPRPFLIPSAPPAFLLLDPNLQTLNKHVTPISRSDSTKTTMVNVLPISAYSKPLSVAKTKKCNIKTKIDAPKKSVKKSKTDLRPKQLNEITSNDKILHEVASETVNSNKEIKNVQNSNEELRNKNISSPVEVPKKNNCNKEYTNQTSTCEISNENAVNTESQKKHIPALSPITAKTDETTSLSIVEKSSEIDSSNKTTVNNNMTSEKEVPVTEKVLPAVKEKENPLNSTLCDHTDAGNARLELAEELLAASPTAAFLMSFPLVSGNRAESPADDTQNNLQPTKENTQRRIDVTEHSNAYYNKQNSDQAKQKDKTLQTTESASKQNSSQKYIISSSVGTQPKISKPLTLPPAENSFLNPTLTPSTSTTCIISDASYGLEFDCNLNKTTLNQISHSCSNKNNIFYKTDPFSTVKSAIYSTSSISSGHEFNSLGLYPCAVEKYASKNKSDFANTEENLMKIGSSRLTYDIDLGWSHKSFDFVNCCTSSSTFNKDSNLLTTTPASYTSGYNPFNPEFHNSLSANQTKKENVTKPSSSLADTMSGLYSQTSNLWPEDIPFYSGNVPKTLPGKDQNFYHTNQPQNDIVLKNIAANHYGSKQVTDVVDRSKAGNVSNVQQSSEKYTKKSPNKMHINWMTSETRSVQSHCQPTNEVKEIQKASYNSFNFVNRKQEQSESNYFPISIHNYPPQPVQEDVQLWPSARPLGTTEVTIEPPPINLPTLVGDLALGPHDKKRQSDNANKAMMPNDVQNVGNFLSVTQLMNRTNDDTNMTSRYHNINTEPLKPNSNTTNKQNTFLSEANRKNSRVDAISQPCYMFNDFKGNTYDNSVPFSQNKTKVIKSEKTSSKVHKNNYSAESLIKGGTCSQKIPDGNNAKFITPTQKFHDFTAHDSSVAQVSHFPPILDYSDNTYSTQQYAGTTLYNSTTNTISNSFYSNLMQGTSNLMTGNYGGGSFSSDYMDYNQTGECNYSNQKYDEIKMRHNTTLFHQEKVNYKNTRRDSTSKHKLECSKKESNKKYQNKRPKLNTESEEWHETSYLPWQNKTSKRPPNLGPEELPYANYMSNQMPPTQYQSEYFNSHIIPTNVQGMSHNVDRSLTSFPAMSRANFSLSAIFPEITMKVQ